MTAAAGPDDVWVVGKQGQAHHFDGSAWSPVAVGIDADWYGVWGPDPSTIYMVGEALDPANPAAAVVLSP